MTRKIPALFVLLAPASVCAQAMGQAAIDACSLLSSAEISKAIGVTVDAGVPAFSKSASHPIS